MTPEPSQAVLSMYAGLPRVEVRPAAKVWTGLMPLSLQHRVAFFRREGFLILRSVLSKKEQEELSREVDRLVHDHRSLPRIREGFDLEPSQHPERMLPTLRKIGGVTDLSPAFAKLMKHREICAILRAIMGDRLQLFRDVVMMKPARVGREKPWHQDSAYWPWRPMALVSAMTALDDADEGNGCLQVIPRSHLTELQHYGQELQVDIRDLQSQTRYVPLKAGDTLLFHSLLLHASEPNLSCRDRRVAIISYKTPDLEYIGKGEPIETLPIGE
jgi:phytanoyl-CoA hydroxylase